MNPRSTAVGHILVILASTALLGVILALRSVPDSVPPRTIEARSAGDSPSVGKARREVEAKGVSRRERLGTDPEPSWVAGALIGRCVDERERPLSGITVTARVADDRTSPGDPERNIEHRATTAADGTFRIEGLMANRDHAIGIDSPEFGAPDGLRFVAISGGGQTDAGTFVLAEFATVRGIVCDDEGRALPGAVVFEEIYDDEISGPTAADGRFEVRVESRTDHVLTARRSGYVADLTASNVVKLDPGAVRDEFRITMCPAIRVTGVVRDSEARPIAKARIVARTTERALDSDASRVKVKQQFAVAASSDAGEFAFDAPTDRDYFIEASAPGFETHHVLIRRGETRVPLVLSRLRVVAVRVVDSKADAVEAIPRLSIVDYDRLQHRLLAIDPTALRGRVDPPVHGRYEIAVDRDEFVGDLVQVVAHVPGFLMGVSEPFRIEPERTEILLPLERGGSVAGRVVDSAGRPAADAVVSVQCQLDDDEFESWSRAVTDRDGRFRIECLPAGRFDLFATHGDAESRTPVTIEIAADRASDEVVLELASVGTIEGTIRDHGVPIEGVEVRSVEDGIETELATSDARGNYRIGGVAVGELRLVIASDEDTDLGSSHAAPRAVRVEANRVSRADFDLVDTDYSSIVGSARMNGEVAARVRVVVSGALLNWAYYEGVTNRSGEFRFMPIRAGEYTVALGSDDGAFTLVEKRVLVRPSSIASVRLDALVGALHGRIKVASDLVDDEKSIDPIHLVLRRIARGTGFVDAGDEGERFTTGQVGSFRRQTVPAGEYILEASVKVDGERMSERRRVVISAASTTFVEMEIVRPGSLEIQLPSVSQYDNATDNRRIVVLFERSDGVRWEFAAEAAQGQAHRFRIGPIEPGSYRALPRFEFGVGVPLIPLAEQAFSIESGHAVILELH